jgi:hypothetical protein
MNHRTVPLGCNFCQPKRSASGQHQRWLAGWKIDYTEIRKKNAMTKSTAECLGTSLFGSETLGICCGPLKWPAFSPSTLNVCKDAARKTLTEPHKRCLDATNITQI